MNNKQRAVELINTALNASPKIYGPPRVWRGQLAEYVWRKFAPWHYDALTESIASALDTNDALQSHVDQQSDWIEKIVSVAEADIGNDWEVAVEINREVIDSGYKLLLGDTT